MAPFHRNKPLDEERQKRRIHKIVPWIKNPLQGVDREHLVFAPRQEASTLELFFDLFFVANLATFTAYHSINDHSSLFAYVGFFVIIWATWFHVTLHDVRFAHDTIYERACKTIQMCAFVGFALVGSAFAPGTPEGDNMNFRVLCYVLVLTRVLFALQYLIVGIFVGVAHRRDIFLPLFLNILTYVVAAVAYAAMIPAFPDKKAADESNGIYAVWWVVLLIETVATITISMVWRMLSFKKTHLVERMGLLTLIVIGEGAIGVTKTIGRMMGKGGLDPEGTGLVLCIILLLVAIWMIYFDNHPHGHYGTIRQQIWALMHFPLHLAIVGIVEGAQQVALARYVLSNFIKLEKYFVQACFKDHLDGVDLALKLNETITYYQLDKKLESAIWVRSIDESLIAISETPGICATATGKGINEFPQAILVLFGETASAIYMSLGLKIPLYADDVIAVALESWRLIYLYFWTAMLVLLACFITCMVLIRRNKMDAFDWVSLFDRSVAFVVAAAILGLAASEDLMYEVMQTPAILPVGIGLLFMIIVLDRIAAWVANRWNRKSGDALTGDSPDGHGDHSGHSGHATPGEVEEQKQGAGVAVVPLHHQNSYNPLGGGIMPQYNYPTVQTPGYAPVPPTPLPYAVPPPQVVPQPTTYTTAYAPGGYMPVHNGPAGPTY